MMDNPFQLKLEHDAKLCQLICINNHQIQQLCYLDYLMHISCLHIVLDYLIHISLSCSWNINSAAQVSILAVCVSMIRFESSFFQSRQENVRIKPNTMNLFLTKVPQSFLRSFVLLVCLFLRCGTFICCYICFLFICYSKIFVQACL